MSSKLELTKNEVRVIIKQLNHAGSSWVRRAMIHSVLVCNQNSTWRSTGSVFQTAIDEMVNSGELKRKERGADKVYYQFA